MRKDWILWVGMAFSAASVLIAAPAGPLRLSAENPRYFALPDGRAVYLAGAHDGWEWQDYAWGDTSKEAPFEWEAFLRMLADNGHNVMRFWSVEHTRINGDDADSTVPMPWLRVKGQGRARDGGDKFDLDRFNPRYFDRLRERVGEAGERGIYVIVMLFQGWSIDDKGGKVNPWPFHPFHRDNNVNGLDGDVDGDGQGSELHTWLGAEHPVTRWQRAYVRRVVETVREFDHVLFEVANESHTASLDWQNRMVDFVRECEGSSSRRHPVGITVPFGGARRAGLNRELLASRADWISPNREFGRGFNYRDNPPPADGRKVMLVDSDHLHGNKLRDVGWVWRTFCRGHNVLFMDRWTEEPDDPLRGNVRRAIGVTVRLAAELDLGASVPSVEVASTRFCLMEAGQRYLVYQPDDGEFSVDLAAAEGVFAADWFDPVTGEKTRGESVMGGARVTFKPPTRGGVVLLLSR